MPQECNEGLLSDGVFLQKKLKAISYKLFS